MNEARKIYMGQDMALIIPTKDRPQKIIVLLNSMTSQTIACGRVIIMDGGQSVSDIGMSFSDMLPMEHYTCFPLGQISQKNKEISFMGGRTSLFGFLDDDIVLEPLALERMITL